MIAIVTASVLTAALVARATDGRLAAGDAATVFDTVSIDSRTLERGALFVALLGDRFDGHDFVEAALSRGAAGLVVSFPPERATGAAVIVVRDTLQALQALGRHVRRASGARVVAVTGSAGKTTTKEMTAAILARRYTVFRNKGNLNNHIGLPLSLIGLTSGPDVAVVEFGMNHEGEIRTLVRIAEPDVRVWTNVGDAHIGHFGSREAVARAKAEILDGAQPATVVVSNADDPLVRAAVAKTRARVITFGESADATVRATDIADRGFEGTRATVRTPAGTLDLDIALPGRAQLSNVLAATAVATDFGVSSGDIESAIATFKPVARRGALTPLASGARLVDDSYNASPAAVRAMLAALAATPVTGRRIAVLGEMLELGDLSWALHEECGRAVAEAGVDELVVIGGEMAQGLVAGAIAGGLPQHRVRAFNDSASAAPLVRDLVAPGDLVLVKGSRGTRTDIVSDRLLEVA